MPAPGTPSDRLAFPTIGTFGQPTRARGTLALVESGERLAFDSAWLRHRHLQPGISSPVAVLAALTLRTRRITLGTSSVVEAEEAEDFAEVQASFVRAVRTGNPTGWVSQRLVVIPTDMATPEQRARYTAHMAARTPRTTAPQGPARLLFARDLLGSSEEIAEALYAHAGFREVTEVVLALPFDFAPEDHQQLLTDTATRLGSALGWRPGG